MENIPVTFDQLPAAVYELRRKVDDLTDLLKSVTGHQAALPDRWFSIEELSEYLPGRPAVTTLYGKVQRREIPYVRNGKRLIFLQSDIDGWLQNSRIKTNVELSAIADKHISQKKAPLGPLRRQKGGQVA